MNERENYELIAGVCQHQTGAGVLCNGNQAPNQRKLLTYANFTRPYHIQLLFFLTCDAPWALLYHVMVHARCAFILMEALAGYSPRIHKKSKMILILENQIVYHN